MRVFLKFTVKEQLFLHIQKNVHKLIKFNEILYLII